MKKNLSLISAFFLLNNLFGDAFAQSPYSVGFKAGIISNRFFSTEGYQGNTYTAYTNSQERAALGITAELFRSKHFMLMPEVFYLERGAATSTNDFNNSKPYLSLLSFTVLPAYKFNLKSVSLYICGGPQLEILLKNNLQYVFSYISPPNSTFGFTAGIGFEKPLTRKLNITGDIRYSRDLSYLSEGRYIDGNNYYYKNSSFEFLLGLNFNIGGNK